MYVCDQLYQLDLNIFPNEKLLVSYENGLKILLKNVYFQKTSIATKAGNEQVAENY